MIVKNLKSETINIHLKNKLTCVKVNISVRLVFVIETKPVLCEARTEGEERVNDININNEHVRLYILSFRRKVQVNATFYSLRAIDYVLSVFCVKHGETRC